MIRDKSVEIIKQRLIVETVIQSLWIIITVPTSIAVFVCSFGAIGPSGNSYQPSQILWRDHSPDGCRSLRKLGTPASDEGIHRCGSSNIRPSGSCVPAQ